MNKIGMRKMLRAAKKELLRDKEINSPVYYIHSGINKREVLRTQPEWKDQDSKAIAMLGLREFCNLVEANEVISVSDTYMHNYDEDIPEEALCVTSEKSGSFQIVILPYKRNPENKISFGKEIWESRAKKMEGAYGEGLVK